LIVRHFLPANLAEELASAVVGYVSDGALSLSDLAETQVSSGHPALQSWMIETRNTEGELANQLQYALSFLIWDGDQTPGTRGDDSEGARLSELELSLHISSADLGNFRSHLLRENIPSQLSPFILALQDLSSLLRESNENRNAPDGHSIDVSGIISRFAGEDFPLAALMLKHLGDLAADTDDWEVSLRLYQAAQSHISRASEADWSALLAVFATPLEQSHAMAQWVLEGPETAAPLLETLVNRGVANKDPLALLNASHDALNAMAALDRWPEPSMPRGHILQGPQIAITHDTGMAFGYLIEGRYNDAHRRFWATLRRQTALGITSDAKATKSEYARALFEHLTATLGQHNEPKDFAMAARLLVDSGRQKAIETIQWDASLVTRYVDVTMIDSLFQFSSRHAGAENDRSRAIVALFCGWLGKINAGQIGAAKRMLEILAELAGTQRYAMMTNLNVGGAAMRALRSIGYARPEFRSIAIDSIEHAVVGGLTGSSRMVDAAIETAFAYRSDFAPDVRVRITTKLLDWLDQNSSGGDSIALRSALNLLSSDAVLELLRDTDSPFARRTAGTLLRLSFANESELVRVMYVLRDLDPALVDDEVQVARLDEIVEQLATHAENSKSSWAAANAGALLVAPAISGSENVRRAISALEAIILAASTARRAPGAFSDAYDPLLTISQNYREIAAAIKIDSSEFITWIEPLGDALVAMWRHAKDNPLLFTSFALPPPTTPNRVLVHNWTFASLAIASMIGRTDAVEEAIDVAAENSLLSDPIGVARAVRAGIDHDAFADAVLENETSSAFYAALGRRLVTLRGMETSAREEAIRRLLNRCLDLGPNGLDVGVLTAALSEGLSLAESQRTENYIERTRHTPAIRHSVVPLISALILDRN
jgi:tetratricopeptide (TPR) repeat protein